MSSRLDRIIIVSRAITTLDISKANTSSHKYELTLAQGLACYTAVTILSLAAPADEGKAIGQPELIGLKAPNKHFGRTLARALQKYRNENAVVLFWGFDPKVIGVILYSCLKTKHKCIAFEYDSYKPYVSTLPQPKRLLCGLYLRAGMAMVRHCNGFILFQRKAVTRLQIERKKYLVCKPGFKAKQINRSTDKDRFVVVYSGSFTKLNGINSLLEAFDLLQNEGIEFILCGEGPMEKEVIEAAEKFSFVHYGGLLKQAELDKVYEKADALLNLRVTNDEAMDFSFPSKLFEYISMQIPIITTCILPEAEFADNATIVDKLDAEHIAEAILSVRDNYAKAELKARHLSDYIQSTYSNEEMTRQIYCFMEKIVQ